MPVDFGLTLDVTAKQLRPDLWFGGSPPRALRLTETGRRAWDELRNGRVASTASAVLARRLTDAGMAHPVPPAATTSPDVTVIVPAHDRVADLDRCLAALGSDVPVVVVDDASRDGAGVARICASHGATLIRRDENGGPGAARNTGLAHVQSEFVAFVDSDCVPPLGWLAPLLAHLADPLVAAVAPRIVGAAGDSWAGRYTRERGSLDLGDLPARVMPRSRITYVPSAALVVRQAALDDVGVAFDGTLRVGEDVDLVWRLSGAGWRIRYEPSVHVTHREPATWPQLLSRRFRYGTSAGPLAQRHPDAISPLVLHPWPTLTVAAALARRPLVAAGVAGIGAAAMARTLRAADVPATGLLPAMANAVRQTWLGLGRYLTQFAAPALLAALCVRRTRFAAAALLLAQPLAAWAPRRVLDPVRFTLGSLADETAYGTGVWVGSARARTLRAIRPVVIWRPLRIDTRRS
jgi:mycofactocin system glycosyltransferase